MADIVDKIAEFLIDIALYMQELADPIRTTRSWAKNMHDTLLKAQEGQDYCTPTEVDPRINGIQDKMEE